MERAGSAAALRPRDSDRAEASRFRRHWSWWDRTVVLLAGTLLALVLRVLYATLRVRLIDPAGVLVAQGPAGRVLFAAWHDGIVLLPLVVLRSEVALRPRVMLSWHRDAEIAAQAVRRFGVGVIRGSSTRGWAGAIRGLLEAHRRGEDLVVVPDGPRGPRHVAKDGVALLAHATGRPVVAVGCAARPARRLRSWDRLQIPWPFARVALVFSPPVPATGDVAATRAAVQVALEQVAGEAARLVGSAVRAP